MAKPTLTALQEKLGSAAALLPSLTPLDDADQARLCALIDSAKAKQAESLAAATEESLDHVPALLRGTIRKLLFR